MIMATHYWVTASRRAGRDEVRAGLVLGPVLAVVDAHRRLRGPYTAAGTLLRLIGDDALERCPGLGARHYIEIQETTPELANRVPPINRPLESIAREEGQSRFPARLHTLRVAHGLVDLLVSYLGALGGGPRALVVENADEADATDREFLAVLLRRVSPELLTVVVCSGEGPLADPPGPVPVSLPKMLGRHAAHIAGPAGIAAAAGIADGAAAAAGIADGEVGDLARRFVDGDGISDDPGELAAYQLAGPELRAALHDQRRAVLEAIADAEPSLQMGAIPYHAEHGTDPAKAGVAALRLAQSRCTQLGFYQPAAEYGMRGLSLVNPANDNEEWWKFSIDTAVCLAVGGRAAEAEALHHQSRMLSTDPLIHMALAYESGMLYARHYDTERRDQGLARAWFNEAIAIASWLRDPKLRSFYTVFYGNGLALVETRVAKFGAALRLLEDGITRLDSEMAPGEEIMHQIELRYNRAQVHGMSGRLEEALDDYNAVMRIDDTLSDHYFNRGNILRRLGRTDEAIADYLSALRLEAPFAEGYYNLGDARLELGLEDQAVADFSRAIELDPEYVVARLARASLLADRGQSGAAMDDVLAGLEQEPGNAHLLSLRGRLLAEQGDARAARQALDAALAADPGLAEAWAILGQVAFEAADLDQAVAALDRAVELSGAPEVRYNRAVVYQAAGRLTEAIQDLDLVVDATGDQDAQHLLDTYRDAVSASQPAAS
jgi:tetratricopeptide (TPR) repeat protein